VNKRQIGEGPVAFDDVWIAEVVLARNTVLEGVLWEDIRAPHHRELIVEIEVRLETNYNSVLLFPPAAALGKLLA
jgi:hypothetical protein